MLLVPQDILRFGAASLRDTEDHTVSHHCVDTLEAFLELGLLHLSLALAIVVLHKVFEGVHIRLYRLQQSWLDLQTFLEVEKCQLPQFYQNRFLERNQLIYFYNEINNFKSKRGI